MAKIVRLGDTSSHGGSMISASATFVVNGVLVCVDGDMHSCPIKDHGVTSVSSGATLKSNGRSVIHTGNTAGCGATILTGGSVTTN